MNIMVCDLSTAYRTDGGKVVLSAFKTTDRKYMQRRVFVENRFTGSLTHPRNAVVTCEIKHYSNFKIISK